MVTFFRVAAIGSGLLTTGILLTMLLLGWPLLTEGQFLRLLSQPWQPAQGIFGIYPMIIGSVAISLLATMLSLPLSLGAAFVCATLAPPAWRRILLGLVRFMAGIPTVVYGFVAVFLLVPFMRELLTRGSGLSILTASAVLAVLIAPTMIVFFVNGLRSVDRSFCLAVDALGGKPVQKLLYLQLPQAWPALLSGAILGLGRAMGDTLISLMLAGNSISVPESVNHSARTLTAHIALVIAADFDSMEFKTIFTCGLVLYLFTFVIVVTLRTFATAATRKR